MPETNGILQKANEYAKILHSEQKRKNGESMYDHVIHVKENLESVGVTDETTLAAALLHNSLETISRDELSKEFGEDITSIVENLNVITNTPVPISAERSSERVQSLHKLIIQMSKDIRVLLIRLADRLDNVRTTEGFSQEEKIWIAKNTMYIYAPIAKAVGIFAFTRELENESLKILEPERYKKIEKFLKTHLKKAEKELILAKHEIVEFLKSKGYKNFEVTYREKSIYSTHAKAIYKAKKGDIKNDEDFEGLFDLLGIRVLVENEAACYDVLAFIQQKWNVIQEEFDDYIANPKPTGYRTLQTAVWLAPQSARQIARNKATSQLSCEIQIRTFEMHETNEFGSASHFAYKYGGSKRQNSYWIKELIELKDGIQESLVQTSEIKLFEDEVFVFTPKGDLITLPAGATALDFAYCIHSTIGNNCTGAFVNKKIVKLDTVLNSGDTVEIITQKSHKPSVKWLDIVKTKEAKKEIRKSLGI